MHWIHKGDRFVCYKSSFASTQLIDRQIIIYLRRIGVEIRKLSIYSDSSSISSIWSRGVCETDFSFCVEFYFRISYLINVLITADRINRANISDCTWWVKSSMLASVSAILKLLILSKFSYPSTLSGTSNRWSDTMTWRKNSVSISRLVIIYDQRSKTNSKLLGV